MVYGKGYLLNCTWKDNKKMYNIWSSIIRRCYCKNHVRHNDYTKVCERWLCFDYFIEDVIKLDGWDLEKFEKGEIQLDKDFKQFDFKIKIYSPETCVWLDKTENNKLQSRHCYKFRAISPNGEVKIYNNQHECARENNLNVGNINRCLKGKRKSHYKWRFEYI